ncbi:hypothetical protein PI124_g8717 [Phytophthora idaei]|nr:hypothetical protein PI125_g10631 [Phytophthora idaei]KAG3153624.1 hypothetical protein PI126_g9999 [Phytophthora idaei]KAG3246571.1 hypothetical protein PI124_g8717 [Phytophthora idaei]
MRTLPSSTSAGNNLRRLADGPSDAASYRIHRSSVTTRSPSQSGSISANAHAGPSNVASSETMTVNRSMQILTPTTGTSMAASVSIGDRGSKKSLAYLHTKYHELLVDHLGKSFERRSCNYCGIIFSFRTTSAPLRHMRKVHPEKIQPDFRNAESQGTDNGVQLTEQVSTEDVQSRTSSDNTADAATTNVSSRKELQRESSAASLASSTASEEEYTSCSTPKRRRGGEDETVVSSSENPSDTYNANRTKVSKTTRALSSKLTASQQAILHFLHHYEDELPQPAMRLRFAKHLTYNVAEAEMYNVLDPATQLEFIREFARTPANN